MVKLNEIEKRYEATHENQLPFHRHKSNVGISELWYMSICHESCHLPLINT